MRYLRTVFEKIGWRVTQPVIIEDSDAVQ